jgi:hypothetical protein
MDGPAGDFTWSAAILTEFCIRPVVGAFTFWGEKTSGYLTHATVIGHALATQPGLVTAGVGAGALRLIGLIVGAGILHFGQIRQFQPLSPLYLDKPQKNRPPQGAIRGG